MLALAQFGADDPQPSLNNSNFSTLPDGQGGIMRMFEFSEDLNQNPLTPFGTAAWTAT